MVILQVSAKKSVVVVVVVVVVRERRWWAVWQCWERREKEENLGCEGATLGPGMGSAFWELQLLIIFAAGRGKTGALTTRKHKSRTQGKFCSGKGE